MHTIMVLIAYFAISTTSFAKSYELLKVLDGGTVVLDYNGVEKTVGFIGVESPQVKGVSPGYPPAVRAGKFLNSLLVGERVYIEWGTDQYAILRPKALFYLYRAPDSLFVNQEIIRQGHGKAVTTSTYKYSEDFMYWQENAEKHFKGQSEYSDDMKSYPTEFKVFQQFPNPFSFTSAISYDLAKNGYISLEFLDMTGRLAETIATGYQQAGSYRATINASNMASGLYTVKLEADGQEFTMKFVLTR